MFLHHNFRRESGEGQVLEYISTGGDLIRATKIMVSASRAQRRETADVRSFGARKEGIEIILDRVQIGIALASL